MAGAGDKEEGSVAETEGRMRKDHPQEGDAPDKCCKGVGNRGKLRGVKSKRLRDAENAGGALRSPRISACEIAPLFLHYLHFLHG